MSKEAALSLGYRTRCAVGRFFCSGDCREDRESNEFSSGEVLRIPASGTNNCYTRRVLDASRVQIGSRFSTTSSSNRRAFNGLLTRNEGAEALSRQNCHLSDSILRFWVRTFAGTANLEAQGLFASIALSSEEMLWLHNGAPYLALVRIQPRGTWSLPAPRSRS